MGEDSILSSMGEEKQAQRNQGLHNSVTPHTRGKQTSIKHSATPSTIKCSVKTMRPTGNVTPGVKSEFVSQKPRATPIKGHAINYTVQGTPEKTFDSSLNPKNLSRTPITAELMSVQNRIPSFSSRPI